MPKQTLKTGVGHDGAAPASGEETLTVIDNRTGTAYEVPITDGAIPAHDFRQIKTSDDDFGLMVYDPGLHEHGLLPQRCHPHRRRARDPGVPRLPD